MTLGELGATLVRYVSPAPEVVARSGDHAALPAFTAAGTLPAGVHDASLGEFFTRFGTTPRRRQMIDHMVDALRLRGLDEAYVAGSFVTAKRRPGDIDMVVRQGSNDFFGGGITTLRETMRGLQVFAAEPHSAAWRQTNPSMLPSAERVQHHDHMLDFFATGRNGAERGLVLLHLT